LGRSQILIQVISYWQDQIKYTFNRVYNKDRKDLSVVKEICNVHFRNIPAHYLIADICRVNLLLEIEGVAEIA